MKDIKKGDLICVIEKTNFYYGGYSNGWHIVFTDLETYHIGNNILQLPGKKECQKIYDIYYR